MKSGGAAGFGGALGAGASIAVPAGGTWSSGRFGAALFLKAISIC